MKTVILSLILATAPVFALALDCDQPSKPITGEDSPNYQHFKELLAKGTSAELSEFLMLWYPERGDGLKMESPFFACEHEPTGYLASPNHNDVYGLGNFYDLVLGEPPLACRPDVLYSWGPADKTQITRQWPDGQQWTGGLNTFDGSMKKGTIFASISAVSTFAYGPVLVRFKVKKDAKYVFKLFGTRDGAVGIRQGNFHDFAINDASILESISSGTPEIYDEVVRDILHYQEGRRVSTYLSGKLIDYYPNETHDLRLLVQQSADGHKASVRVLKENLLELIREILKGEGRIVYNKGVCRNRGLAYATKFPSYINPISEEDIKKQ